MPASWERRRPPQLGQELLREFEAFGLVGLVGDPELQGAFEFVVSVRVLHQSYDRARVHLVLLFEQRISALRSEVEAADTDTACREFQSRHPQQVDGGRRQGPEAIHDFFGQAVDGGVVGRGGQALVQRQACRHVGHVTFRQQCRQAQLHFRVGRQRPVEHGLASSLEGLDRLLEQVEVHGETDLGELAALRLAQELARATDLKVMRGQHEPGTQVLQRLDGLEALDRVGRQRLAGRRQ